jgi:predicted ArsR family transcriptional regulator
MPRPDDVLGQPTRARLFSLLSELKRPARTEELAEQVGLHANGVRAHLERMAAAGLVTRTRTRQAVGRPYDHWSISPDANPAGRPPHAYADLGQWLARAIPPSRARLREVEASGRQIGRELAPSDSGTGDVADVIGATLTAMGFQPRRDDHPDERVVYCLGNCPYQEAVETNQEVVCTLHRGITRGLLDALDPDARLVAFEPRDPETAGCLIELSLGRP